MYWRKNEKNKTKPIKPYLCVLVLNMTSSERFVVTEDKHDEEVDEMRARFFPYLPTDKRVSMLLVLPICSF